MSRARVPKATVDEDNDTMLPEDDVGVTANSINEPNVFAKSESGSVDGCPSCDLRRSVSAPIALH
jgi:hypothetical protein